MTGSQCSSQKSLSNLSQISKSVSTCNQKSQSGQLQTTQDIENKEIIQKLKLYQAYFTDLKQLPTRRTLIQHLDEAELLSLKIQLKPNLIQNPQKWKQPQINLESISSDGKLAVFQVAFGVFKIGIDVFNIDEDSPNVDQEKLMKGSYGSVRKINDSVSQYCIKRINLKSLKKLRTSRSINNWNFKQKILPLQNDEFSQVIYQVALLKLSSLLKTGPAYKNYIGFDILLFNDCAEFSMQCGLNSKEFQSRLSGYETANQLKLCLYKMHLFHLIHKDIKPNNILYSFEHKGFVFCDFGLSSVIKESIGFKTETRFQGTKNYASEEMCKAFYSFSKIPVDLYQNDQQCLTKTIKEIILSPKLSEFAYESSSGRDSYSMKIQDINSNVAQNQIQPFHPFDESLYYYLFKVKSFLMYFKPMDHVYHFKEFKMMKEKQIKEIILLIKENAIHLKENISFVFRLIAQCKSLGYSNLFLQLSNLVKFTDEKLKRVQMQIIKKNKKQQYIIAKILNFTLPIEHQDKQIKKFIEYTPGKQALCKLRLLKSFNPIFKDIKNWLALKELSNSNSGDLIQTAIYMKIEKVLMPIELKALLYEEIEEINTETDLSLSSNSIVNSNHSEGEQV